MSRRKTFEQLEREAQEADDARSALWKKQQACNHYDAQATRFHWTTGRVAELHCPDCDATQSFDEEYL